MIQPKQVDEVLEHLSEGFYVRGDKLIFDHGHHRGGEIAYSDDRFTFNGQPDAARVKVIRAAAALRQAIDERRQEMLVQQRGKAIERYRNFLTRRLGLTVTDDQIIQMLNEAGWAGWPR